MSSEAENPPTAIKRQKLAVDENSGDDQNQLTITVTTDANDAVDKNGVDIDTGPSTTATEIGEQKNEVRKPNAIEENDWFTTVDKVNDRWSDAKGSWDNSNDFNEANLKLFQKPFKHGEICDFVKNLDFVQEFTKLFSKIEFHEKASDLFQFNQSNDLNSVVDPHIFAISEYLKEKVLPFMKEITGLPLNQTIDMFLSVYRQTDFLLCHDDELDSRRIAFIWYLSEDWKEEYGGTLDLYSANDSFHPENIQKKIVPAYNKFVFFEVGVTSFHQVSEVLQEGKERLALSGWFYGEPLPRPKVEYPIEKSFNILESVHEGNGVFKKFCAEMYLNSEIFSEINEQLAEESEVLVPGFFRDDAYELICKSIVESDVSKSLFSKCGPPNLANYEETIQGPQLGHLESDESSQLTMNSLRELFYSKEFLSFLEQITEFPFTTCDKNRVRSSLQKFSQGSYNLLRSGGTKQTGSKPTPDEVVDEPEEEPNLVDVMFYFANNWEESRGGSVIYSTSEGEQLITVPPEGNCLAVVVRSSIVNSYTNYVNCLAKDDVYFVYKMTFAFDGNFGY